jgi:transposase
MLTDRERKLLREQPPEIIEALFESLRKENDELRHIVKEIEAEKLKKDQQSLNIEEQLKTLRKKIFGRSKEDRVEASDRPRDKSQQDVLLFSQSAFPSVEDRNGSTDPKKNELPETIIIHELSDEDLKRESVLREIPSPSSDQWQKIEGVFDQSTKIQVIETRYIKEIHKRSKYKLKSEHNSFDKDIIITAPCEPALLPGMGYTTDLVAKVACDKYIYHMPLERQTRKMEAKGLKGMRTSTLTRFCALVGASLEPVADEILKELKGSDLALHLDETPWKIQRKEQKDGYMWIISNRYGSYYFFKPTRSGQVIKEKLEGYDGPVVTDGFSGYNILDELNIKQGFCWAHARRKFIELEAHDDSVKPILDDIDGLFEIDRQAQSFPELKEKRRTHSRATVMSIYHQLQKEHLDTRAGSQKRKAIEYLLKRWDGFTHFIYDERMPLSNNEAERTIRHAVVGRKNFYGAATHSGADTAATIYTIVESAKKNDIEPESYIKMALKMVEKGDLPPTPLAYAKSTRQ